MRYLFTFLILITSSFAQNKIIVGTKTAEPFVIKQQDGSWGGVSFELWRVVSNELHLNYDVVVFDLEGVIKSVETEEVGE